MELFMFTKSGSIVSKTGKPDGDGGLVEVRRVDTGKKMLCPVKSLVPIKQVRVCCYCGDEVEEAQGCCKEVHNELIWITDDGIQITVPR